MPLYRYHCDECGHAFTLLEPFHNDSLKICTRCGKLAARREISRVGVVYKGSGFHSTDYRRNGGGNHRRAPEREEEKAAQEG
ncbi:MAG: zinc ribbon domain-containing protein [Candidatus Acetothermia bacterium]|jgi:putative FmdB family regulatory protein|nr:zinc ribbon domain-containing protein [Candidatus Acetothermia bacterium]MDH7505560.1 zinc ribbon domain-containing protein [Candidatus Acetothermia bacterium]